jgi:hypothetical protein
VATSADAEEEVVKNVARGSASGVGVEGEHSTASLDLGSDDFIQDALQGMVVVPVADPSITAPMPDVLGDDSSKSEGEDIGGGGGARSPSDAEVGGTSRRRTTDIPVLEVSEDDAEAQSPAPLQSVAFRATAQHTDVGTFGAILDSLYLGEGLLSIFALYNCFMFWSFDLTCFGLVILVDLTKALTNAGKDPADPAGMDVAQIGLGAPPRPLLFGETPRPSSPGMEHGTGCSYCLFLSFELSLALSCSNYLVDIARASNSTISG